jgi:flagellar hook-associated protein 1 FlgK
VSGVNLDEEAANLLRFQQAYQAIAQVISVADSTFQTLLDVVRR